MNVAMKIGVCTMPLGGKDQFCAFTYTIMSIEEYLQSLNPAVALRYNNEKTRC